MLCEVCGRIFNSQKALNTHKHYHKTNNTIKCSRCSEEFQNRHSLYLHIRDSHIQRGRGQAHILSIEDEELQEFYNRYHSFIYDNHELGQPQSFYNYPLVEDFNIEDLMGFASEIYNDQNQTFKLNLSFGSILQHIETGGDAVP